MGDSQGAAHALMLVPLTSSRWYELGGGWDGGSAPPWVPGAPTAPQQPLGAAGLGEPLSALPLAQHRLLLAALLPNGDIKALCGPFGVQLGFRGARRILWSLSCGPCGPSQEAPGWQGCSVAASVPALGLSTSRLEMRGGEAQLSAAPGVLTHDISCPCLWQRVEPGVPVRSRAPAPPEPPPALL